MGSGKCGLSAVAPAAQDVVGMDSLGPGGPMHYPGCTQLSGVMPAWGPQCCDLLRGVCRMRQAR